MDDGLTLGQAPGYDTDHVDQRRADEIIRSHVRAFNARDLEGLLRTLADDAVWTTGRTTVHSRADLAAFFQGAMTGLDATLSIRTLVTAGRPPPLSSPRSSATPGRSPSPASTTSLTAR